MFKIWGRKDGSNVIKVTWCLGEIGVDYDRIDWGGEFGGNDDPDQSLFEFSVEDEIENEAVFIPFTNPNWLSRDGMLIPAGEKAVTHQVEFAIAVQVSGNNGVGLGANLMQNLRGERAVTVVRKNGNGRAPTVRHSDVEISIPV